MIILSSLHHQPAVEMLNRRRWSVWWWMSADGRAFDAHLDPWSRSWILNTNVVRKGCPKNLLTFFSWIVFRVITNISLSIPLLLIWSILNILNNSVFSMQRARRTAFAYWWYLWSINGFHVGHQKCHFWQWAKEKYSGSLCQKKSLPCWKSVAQHVFFQKWRAMFSFIGDGLEQVCRSLAKGIGR